MGTLVPLHDHIGMNSGEGVPGTCVWCRGSNRLDVPAFIKAVADQPWETPGALLCFLKNEDEARFKVYRMGERGCCQLTRGWESRRTAT